MRSSNKNEGLAEAWEEPSERNFLDAASLAFVLVTPNAPRTQNLLVNHILPGYHVVSSFTMRYV